VLGKEVKIYNYNLKKPDPNIPTHIHEYNFEQKGEKNESPKDKKTLPAIGSCSAGPFSGLGSHIPGR